VTVPADPGWAQPRRHDADAGGGAVDRDNAPTGGGWQPDAWTSTTGLAGLRGEQLADAGDTGHRGGGSHRGDEGRGAGRRRVVLESTDKLTGGYAPTQNWGAGGAANGGLRAEGAAPWMSPGTSRRRADGGVVSRAAGYFLGRAWYRRPLEKHRQGLHLNRPTIRGVREKQITKSTVGAARTVGPLQPRARKTVAPYSTPAPAADYATLQPAARSVIGSEWVQ
jgi:hypothetical protein